MPLELRIIAVGLAIGFLTGVQAPRRVQIREFSEVMALDTRNDASSNVSAGDIDGDGDIDLVIAIGRHEGGRDRIHINDGKGKFTTADLGTEDDSSYAAVFADVDDDKDLDVIVSNDFNTGRVYVNDGKGRFRRASEWGSVDWPSRTATLADLNGDRKPDIIVANRSPRVGLRSATCMNDGAGRFSACTELPVPPATTIVAADVDRDGDVDLVVPNRDGGENVMLFNDGRAGFGRTVKFGPATTSARVAATGDMNGDGWLDLVLGDENIGPLLYLNDGRGAFGNPVQLGFENLMVPYSVAVGDLNRDGSLDVAVGHSGSRGSVLLNDGTGRSFKHIRFGESIGTPYGLAIADLDGDKYPEIIAARNGRPNQVFLNRAGDGIDTVLALERFRSPSVSETLFDAQPAVFETPLVGVWHGQSSYLLDYRSELQVRIDSLSVGQRAGFAARSTGGVIYCLAALTLKEQRPGGEYLFNQIGQTGSCAGSESLFTASLDREGKLHWDASPKTEQPRSPRAVLERKK